MASVQANGITIEFEDEGSGDPLVLVMGLGGQLIDWPRGFVDELLARNFRVVRFDNRDAGLSSEFTSTPPTTGELAKAVVLRRLLQSEYLISDMADDTAGLIDALGLDRPHVVGVSMGGMIAQSLAIDWPSKLRSLTSIMSTTGNRRVGQPTMRVIRRTVRRPVPTRETAVEMGVEAFREFCGPTYDPAEFRRTLQAAVDRSYRPAGTARQTAAIIASGDRTAALVRLDVPTLVIHGMLDTLVRPSGGLATARAVPNSRLLMFNDMAHDLPRTRWSEMADAIRANADRAARVPSPVG